MKLLIYTAEITERLSYTFDFILGDLLGLSYTFTTDKRSFLAYTDPKFSYAPHPVADELFFECATLLFETDISLQPIDFVTYEDAVGFYPVSDRSLMPFDPFASSFSMLARYNEYLLHKKDKYDRYRASQSTNYIAGFLGKPMINCYGIKMKKLLLIKYPELQFKNNKFEYQVSVDVDSAYLYRGQGFNDSARGFIKDFLTSNFKLFLERYRVLFRNRKDPYDTFEYILNICNKYAVKTKFFFLVGNRSNLDKNIPHTHEGFRNIVKNVSRQSDVGVLLSFMSHISNEAMEDERARLEYLSGRKITSNRFNYLRFVMPVSYISISRIGITDDYSMGYSTRIGFRAGTCTPFYFFNLLKNERTTLKIHPFAFMDTTLGYYNKMGPEESLKKILQTMKWVKEVEGPFVSIWHNSSFAGSGVWAEWRHIFETVAKEAAALTEKSE